MKYRIPGLCLGLPLLCCASAVQSQPVFRTIDLTENVNPTQPSYDTDFSRLYLSEAGDVGYRVDLNGPAVTNDNDEELRVWSEGPAVQSALEGDPAPGLGAGVFLGGSYPFYHTHPAGPGTYAFLSRVTGPQVTDSSDFGVWIYGSGGQTNVLRKGDPLGGIGAGLGVAGVNSYYLAEDGTMLFIGTPGPGVSGYGLWIYRQGALSALSVPGRQAPGVAVGLAMKSFTITSFDMAPSGHYTLYNYFDGIASNGETNKGIWTGKDGAMDLSVRVGDIAPGTQAGVTFQNFSQPRTNNLGDLIFMGDLKGPGLTQSNRYGLFAQRGGSLELIAREDSPAPGTDPGVVFDSFFNHSINNAGKIVFKASIDGPGVDYAVNDSGIWAETDAGLELIVRTGDAAPGIAGDAKFQFFDTPAYNSQGLFAFRARVRGDDVSLRDQWGIWATRSDGQLVLVVREDDVFDANDDPAIEDLRTIQEIEDLNWSTNADVPRLYTFNDAGRLVFKLKFGNTSGVFIADMNPPQRPADLDGDGDIDGVDLGLFFASFTGPNNGPPTNPDADLDGDGDVDGVDLSQAFGLFTGPLSPSNVPEPASLLVFAVAGLFAMRRRRG